MNEDSSSYYFWVRKRKNNLDNILLNTWGFEFVFVVLIYCLVSGPVCRLPSHTQKRNKEVTSDCTSQRLEEGFVWLERAVFSPGPQCWMHKSKGDNGKKQSTKEIKRITRWREKLCNWKHKELNRTETSRQAQGPRTHSPEKCKNCHKILLLMTKAITENE